MTLAGPALCITVVYEETTEQEARAVETGPVEASAPLILIDDEGHVVPALAGIRADDPARMAWPVRLTLCDVADGTVRAVRSVEAPRELMASTRQGVRAQPARFVSASEAAVEHVLSLRALTLRHLLDRAEVHACTPTAGSASRHAADGTTSDHAASPPPPVSQ